MGLIKTIDDLKNGGLQKNVIYNGNVLEILRAFPSECVDMVIFSPPYYGLRNYNVEGQWGLEKTFDEYLDKMIDLMREIKRVLKPTGTIWVNFGDCYGGSNNGANDYRPEGASISKNDKKYQGQKGGHLNRFGGNVEKSTLTNPEYNQERGRAGNQKCLLMQPERFAIRCIDEVGLILRNKIVWGKQVLLKKENRTIGSVMPSCLSPETEIYLKDEVGIVAPYKLRELLDMNLENKRILSPTGWKKIKNIWGVECNETIKFKVGSSSEVECSLEHKFPISHDNRRKRYEIKEVSKLRIGKNKMLDRFLFVPIKEFLPNNTEIKLNYRWGKFIGLYAAEGGFVDYSIHKSYQGKFTLHKKETELANDIKWGLEHFKVKYKENFIKNYRTIVFNSREVKNFISKFVLGKCRGKRFDMIAILNTNKEFRRGVFDGIIAGDGHKNKKGRITFGSASKQLRDDLYLLVSSIGLLASKHECHRKDKRTNKIYDAYFLTIPQSLQKEKQCGERKFEKGRPLSAKYKNEFKAKTLKFSNSKIIKKRKKLIDIEVEDGLFLINGGIVSHNSVKDRFNESYEFLYFFVKNKKYYSNLDAVRIQPNPWHNVRGFDNQMEYQIAVRKNKNYNVQGTHKGQQWADTGYSFNDRVRKEIEEYKKKTGKIRGTNSNLPWNPLTGGRIYPIKTQMGKNLPTVWQINPEPHNFQKELGIEIEHFAIFPQALLEIPIQFGCPPDGIVLDPFMGSGTTAIVAQKLGRDFVGIELSPQYCKLAEQRINLMKNLFNKEEK